MLLINTPRRLKQSAEFHRQLAALVRAGVPVVQAFEHISRHPPSGAWRVWLRRVISRVEAGSTLTDAFTVEGVRMPAFDLALLRAGELSGRLAEVCHTLSEHYAARARRVERFLAAMAYPVLLVHLAVVVFPVELLPQLVWQGEVGVFLRQKLLVFGSLYVLVFLVALALQSHRGAGWQAGIERILQGIPGLGVGRRELALARLAGALEALISAGVTIIEAWELAAAASGSPALQRRVRAWKPRLVGGALPSSMVSQSHEFPEVFASLYFTGETSGQLDHELRHLQTFYEDAGSARLNRFLVAVGLLISLGVMGTIAFWIIRFWSGYFRQISDVLGS
jgi:type IV pilus assembly protein PilC